MGKTMAQVVEERAKAQGRAEGRAEGHAEARSRDIVRILEERIGDVPEAVRNRVQAIRDEARLDTLLRAAIHCPHLDAFQSRLAP